MAQAVDKISKINSKIRELDNERTALARTALKEVSKEVFDKYPELNNFAFGISGREYNDEGLYEGLNHVATNLDTNDTYISSAYWDAYDWRSPNSPGAGEEIHKLLSDVGDDALVQACGEYDIVLIEREDPEHLEIEDAGY